jgi:hypothetical protein
MAGRIDRKNLDIYGNKPIPWTRARRQLEGAVPGPTRDAPRTWLATTGPGGRAHLAGVGALWVDGRFYVVSGPGTRKSKNLARHPRCAVAVNLHDLDVVIEGTARRVTDQKTLKRLAKKYAAPWYLYALTPSTAFGVATAKPFGATRWRFSSSR